MPKTIKDLAKELNCSYEAVRKQVKRYEKDLKEHIYTQRKTQYLDDYACDFLRSKRVDSPVVFSKIEYDEAVEALKAKYTALLEKQTQLQEENLLLRSENAKIALLEADNEAARVRIAQAEQDAQNAANELKTAKQIHEESLQRLATENAAAVATARQEAAVAAEREKVILAALEAEQAENEALKAKIDAYEHRTFLQRLGDLFNKGV